MSTFCTLTTVAVVANDGQPFWMHAVTKIRAIGEGFFSMLPNIVIGVVVFVAFYFAAKGISYLVRRFAGHRKKHNNVAMVLARLAHGATLIFGILVSATIIFPGFTPASLIELLGIGSVAFGFAFKEVLQNYLAGIILLYAEPFRINDQIIFKEFEGTVEEIQARATLLRTYDNRRVVIPNAQLFTESLMVNTAHDKRRLQYDVGIGYGDDIEQARHIILKVLKDLPAAIDDPAPEVLAYEIGESSINLRVRWWIEPPRMHDAMDARDQVITHVKKALAENGIDMPFPTQQILFHDQTEETDGDRTRQREGWPAGKQPPKSRGIAAAILDTTPRKGGDPNGNDAVLHR